jgi:hypothetical protein
MNLANLRFRCDRSKSRHQYPGEESARQAVLETQRQLLTRAVSLTPELFPDLAALVAEVGQSLLGPHHAVDAYVMPMIEPQAFAFFHTVASRPTIALSSGMIERCTRGELAYVIGHELGHAAFEHPARAPIFDSSPDSPEWMRTLARQQCAEISADRVGLVAAPEPADAYRAIVKLASGLDSRFLRFDVASFLRQYDRLRTLGNPGGAMVSTHPMFLCRLRSLLWFEMSELYDQWLGRARSGSMTAAELDQRVKSDLASAGGFEVARTGEEILREAGLLCALLIFTEQGQLSHQHQDFLKRSFNEADAQKAVARGREKERGQLEEELEVELAEVASLTEDERQQFHDLLRRIGAEAGPETGAETLKKSRSRVPQG